MSNCTSGPASDCAARSSAVLNEPARRLPEMPRILTMTSSLKAGNVGWGGLTNPAFVRRRLDGVNPTLGICFRKRRIDAHFADQHVVDRTGVGDLQQAHAL